MPITKAQAREQIAALVERFRQTSERERASYNEQQSRIYFILPLFRALGWDDSNPAEVSAEEQISRGFVDFGFYLNGVPAFYLETKKIPENLNNPEWAKQAINYSWLRGVTWAVLSDFEGIKIFNAEWQEKIPSRAVFLDLTWEKYGGEQFDDLWLLSKPSIQAGEIHKVAERYGKRTHKEPVSKILFAQLTQWRRDLFKEIQGWSNLFAQDTQKLDEAVQRFLDRLIFIRTVEDRGVEPPRLRPVLRQYRDSRKKDKNLFHDLLALFREMDSVYNARLFAQHQLDLLEMHNDILLERITNGLYDAPGGYDVYDFNAISADVLGNIYEQYLGFKAIDPTGKEAVDLGKRTKRKSQGIYYTPQFVVRYIVQQTLGKLLQEGADPYKIRVLDPACGSGSFLIEAFDVLDRWIALHGTEMDQQHPRQRRLRILKENIYGVDLDPQAVEVARLNLLLRAASERGLLPMLDNIKIGNSLIDDPAVAGEMAFKWDEKFPDVMAAGGFDVVIGNPPYGASIDLDYMMENYFSCDKRHSNSYTFFMEKALHLLRKKGMLGFIVPNTWLSIDSCTRLREGILSNTKIHSMISTHQIFPSSTDKAPVVDTLITVSQKLENINFKVPLENQDNNVLDNSFIFQELSPNKTIEERLDDLSHDKFAVNITVLQRNVLSNAGSKFTFSQVANIGIQNTFNLKQLEEAGFGVRIGVQEYAVGGGNPTITKEMQEKRVYHSSKKLDDTYFPFAPAGDVKRYQFNWSGTFLKWGANLHRSREWKIFSEPHIVVSRIFDAVEHRLLATLISVNDVPVINNTDVFCIVPERGNESLHYVLGLINSKYMGFYLMQININLRRKTYPKIQTKDLKRVFIRPINFDNPADVENHARMVNMVETMLDLKKRHAAVEKVYDDSRHDLAQQIARLDREIDQLVYQLYDLTPEEIAIVEGTAAVS